MTPPPVVGVVIPTRDGERYLGKAIESVLGQTRQALDVVVVDDGSRNATSEVVRRYAPEVRCVTLARRGLGAARNAGIRAVRGDYLAFLDHDDVWPARKLERQLEPFAKRSAPDVVFGHASEFISPELEAELAGRIRCVSEPRPAALPGTMVVTREALERVGPFPERWLSNDFLAWLLMARERNLREVMLAEHVLSRRLHRDNLSNLEVTRGEYPRVLKESIDRRRVGRAS